MKANPTSGPWEVVPGTCYIYANDPYEPAKGRMMVAQANHDEWSDAPAPEGKLTVATVRGWGRLQYLGKEKAIAIQDANARLIAAAPELLEACVETLNAIENLSADSIDECKLWDAYDYLRDVIAKVEGVEA